MDVHLADDVSDAGDIKFVGFEVVGNEGGNLTQEKEDFRKLMGLQLVEIFDPFFDFRHDEEPGEGGIVFEEDLTGS